MELNEAVRRIFGQHWRLIAMCLILGVAAAALVHVGVGKTYTATSRLVLDTQDPKSRAESMAIADTGRAIATSPSQIAEALAAAKITNRDPITIGEKHVTVSALGTSAVLQLSVSDSNPRIAAALANALAARVIETRLDASNGRVSQTRLDLETRIEAISRKVVTAGVDTRQVLLQQRGALESELAAVMAANATHPEPLVISRADVPTKPDSSKLPTDAALGGVLGFILGIGLAGLVEVMRPTLVGGPVLADVLGTIHLGGLPDERNRVMTGVRLATRAAEVRDVGVIAIGGLGVDVATVANRLETMELELHTSEELTTRTRRVATTGAPYATGDPHSEEKRFAATLEGRAAQTADGRRKPRAAMNALQIRPYSLGNGSISNGSRAKAATGLILVARESVKKSHVDEAGQLVGISGLPVLGLITINSPGALRRTGPAAAEAVAAKADR